MFYALLVEINITILLIGFGKSVFFCKKLGEGSSSYREGKLEHWFKGLGRLQFPKIRYTLELKIMLGQLLV